MIFFRQNSKESFLSASSLAYFVATLRVFGVVGVSGSRARARLSRARRHPSSSLVTVVAIASRLDVHHRPVASRVTIADLIDFTIASLPSSPSRSFVPHGAVDE